MHIVDLRADEESAIRQVAALLVEGFATNWPGAWPDLESALEEVRESFLYQIGKKHVQGNQLSGAGGASAPFVRKIFQIVIDMTSSHLVGSGNGQIIFRQSSDKLLNICAIRLNSQRAFIQFSDKLV